VFWIVHIGSSHRGQASVRRLESAWPTLRLIHLPGHASWLDQAEIYFSIVQRKVVNPNDFTDTDKDFRAARCVRAARQRNRRTVPLGPSGVTTSTSCAPASSAPPPRSPGRVRSHR
jgi:hypothetical protein